MLNHPPRTSWPPQAAHPAPSEQSQSRDTAPTRRVTPVPLTLGANPPASPTGAADPSAAEAAATSGAEQERTAERTAERASLSDSAGGRDSAAKPKGLGFSIAALAMQAGINAAKRA